MSGTLSTCARVAGSIAAFFGAMWAAMLAIGAAMPWPDLPEIGLKLEYFRAHANEYDTLFIGSSRIYHQILPSLFDELTAARGVKTRSFNAGIDGMHLPEMNFYVRELLSCRPQNLRYVFVENGSVRLQVDPGAVGSQRFVYWHDFRTMVLMTEVALATYKAPKKPRFWKVVEAYGDQFSTLWAQIPSFFQRFSNLGRGDFFTGQLMGVQRVDPDRVALGAKGDGCWTSPPHTEIKPESRQTLHEELELRKTKPAQVNFADPRSQQAYDALLASFEKLGARTVQLIPPTTGSRKFHLREKTRSDRLLLEYSDLQKYAPLYEDSVRQDTDHLNLEGAEMWTRILAAEFCDALALQP